MLETRECLVVGALAGCSHAGLRRWNFDHRNCCASVERNMSWRQLNVADCAGRLFPRGPAALKLRSPKLLCVRGTKHVLTAAERSGRRSVSVTRLSRGHCLGNHSQGRFQLGHHMGIVPVSRMARRSLTGNRLLAAGCGKCLMSYDMTGTKTDGERQ